ncbi:MAG: hypothetical protein U9Q82_11130 [Chloroflexota bacterium]|nr:hypothetical protein [Chloroflexota bacterium]
MTCKNASKKWLPGKVLKLYVKYFAPIRARSLRDGLPYTVHAFRAVLVKEGLGVEKVDTSHLFNKAEEGYLLVEEYVFVNLVWRTVFDNTSMIRSYGSKLVLNLNFGSEQPEYYPSLDKALYLNEEWSSPEQDLNEDLLGVR